MTEMPNKAASVSYKSFFFALIVMALWGSLFPMIKIGYSAFQINTAHIPDVIVFASMRFLLSGVFVCLLAYIKKSPLARPHGKSILPILMVALFTVFLHYVCTYIGLSVTDSAKTALLKQLASLFYICFSFLFVKGERFGMYKVIGAGVGFLGIVAINLGGATLRPSAGDVIIIVASVAAVVGTVWSKKSVERASPFWVTGISQLLGGAALLIVGLVMGGTLPRFTLPALFVFLYICAASIGAYVLYAQVQKTETNSRLLIIKFSEPLFACLFGALWLGEDILKWQYLVAFLLISLGILLGSRQKENENESNRL